APVGVLAELHLAAGRLLAAAAGDGRPAALAALAPGALARRSSGAGRGVVGVAARGEEEPEDKGAQESAVHGRTMPWHPGGGRASAPYSVGSTPRSGPSGNAVSIRARSSLVRRRSPAAALSSACAARAALGITKTGWRRSRKRSATCRGVAPWAAAI